MSEVITNAGLKSVPDDGINGSKMTLAQELEGESKLKRTFSLRKGCTQPRIGKRKSKHKDSMPSYGEKPSRKLSFLNSNSLNRLIHKVVHKMTTSFNLNSKNSVYMTYDCADSKINDILSLSSTDICDDVRVPPLRPSFIRGDKVPGVIGLRNHGNTCFINAVLQCLSHTDILAEYFVLDQYKVDLSRRNKLNSKKYGTKGEMTEQLAILLKSIWSCQYNPDISNQFKVVVDKYGSQYRGNNQHDAQEFLLWLLDKVHEDLNTATKKKYRTIKVSTTFS